MATKVTTPDQTMAMSDGLALDQQLPDDVVVVEREATERGRGDDGGAERTDDAADAMDAEHVERVVILEHRLQRHDGPQADHAGNRAEDDRTHRSGKAGGRGDGDETGDGTRGSTEQRGMATGELLGQSPGEGSSGTEP